MTLRENLQSGHNLLLKQSQSIYRGLRNGRGYGQTRKQLGRMTKTLDELDRLLCLIGSDEPFTNPTDFQEEETITETDSGRSQEFEESKE